MSQEEYLREMEFARRLLANSSTDIVAKEAAQPKPEEQYEYYGEEEESPSLKQVTVENPSNLEGIT